MPEESRTSAIVSRLEEEQLRLENWLYRHALPIWWSAGADRARGGFEELLDLQGRPVASDRRFRVQPRQVYCYAAAGMAGWDGPWREAARHGVSYFETRYRRDDRSFAALVSPDGFLVDGKFDLYNQAFALFAYAQMGLACPEDAALHEEKALRLLEVLENYRHPVTGFEEAVPRRLPLRSNPHMHLFEAALTWEEATPDGNPVWSRLSDEIAALCLARLIDPVTGGLREFFDGDWKPYPGTRGRVMEPGHHFEWAWLLVRWGQSRSDASAIEAARRLFDLASRYGICKERKAAVMQLADDFTVTDPSCRLWSQTEWIKAALALAALPDEADRERYWEEALRGISALRRFLEEVPVAGLWRDKLSADGQWVEEAAPASTFYHIVCAVMELNKRVKDLPKAKTEVIR